MAASTAPSAKAQLLVLLNARPSLAASVTAKNLKIRWAAPTEEADYKRDVIWTGRVDVEEENVLGGGSKHEDYTIQVGIQSYRTGDDPQGTEEAWWALHAELAAAVRASPTLNDVLTSGWASLESANEEPQPIAGGGWLAKGTATVRCRAKT